MCTHTSKPPLLFPFPPPIQLLEGNHSCCLDVNTKMHIDCVKAHDGVMTRILFYLASCFSNWAMYFSTSKSGLSISTIWRGEIVDEKHVQCIVHVYGSRTWYDINDSNWVLFGSISAFGLLNQLFLMLVFKLSFLFFGLLLQRCVVWIAVHKTESEGRPTTDLTTIGKPCQHVNVGVCADYSMGVSITLTKALFTMLLTCECKSRVWRERERGLCGVCV